MFRVAGVIVVALFIFACAFSSHNRNCPSCGKFQPSSVDNLKSLKIVNGWDAEDRGFVVLIRAHKGPNDFITFGGVLLNANYVLTAGHSVCSQSASSYVPCALNGTLLYDPKEVFKIYVNVDTIDIRVLKHLVEKNKIPEYRVSDAIKHPEWDGSGSSFPDLALLKLEKDVFMDDNKPICLPTMKNQFDLYNQTVYVAGWGTLRNRDTGTRECYTNDDGPERHKRCRFPFIYEGKTYSDCIRNQPSPSSTNKFCQEFKRQEGEGAMPRPGESLMLWYNIKSRYTLCYYEGKGENGWCGVCLKHALPGQYGYCPPGSPPSQEGDTITEVKRTKHWGFCSANCESSEEATVLQETQLTVLTPVECAVFDNPLLGYHKEAEFCAGKKIPYPIMEVYRRNKQPTNKGGVEQYRYDYAQDLKNTLGAFGPPSRLDFYLGHTDTCLGDSGGPVYYFNGNKAYVVGINSRGDECAGFNQPGIYTDISKYIDWIWEGISNGSCISRLVFNS